MNDDRIIDFLNGRTFPVLAALLVPAAGICLQQFKLPADAVSNGPHHRVPCLFFFIAEAEIYFVSQN